MTNMKTAGALIVALILAVGVYLVATNEEGETSNEAGGTSTSLETQDTNNSATISTESDYMGDYEIVDEDYGTEVSVVVDTEAGTRTITANAIPNHTTGDFPNEGNPNTISEQNLSYTYPLNPTFTGNAIFARTPGVAINGVKLEPATAERAICSSGEVYSIEALQDRVDLGLDINNAHVQPTGEYHYHGKSSLLTSALTGDNDLVHVAFAADGYMIYYSKSGRYAPSYKVGTNNREGAGCSYSNPATGDEVEFGPTKDGSLDVDWEYLEGQGDLDECNGITIDGQYIYLMTDEYPYISRCLNGEFSELQPGSGGGFSAAPNGQPNSPNGQAQPGPPPR